MINLKKLFQKHIFIYLLITIPFSLIIWDIINTLDDRVFLDAFTYSQNPYFDSRYKDFAIWNGHQIFTRWQYPPITIFYMLPAWIGFRLTNLEWVFQFLFKLPQIISAIAIYKILNNKYKLPKSAKLWLLNPLTLILSIQGGFTHITVWFLILTYIYWQEKKYIKSAIFLGLISSLRIYPLMFCFPLILDLLRKNEGKKIITFISIILSTFIIPYIPFIYQNPKKFWDIFSGAQKMFLGPLGSWPLVQKLYFKVQDIFNLNFSHIPLYYSMAFLTLFYLIFFFIIAYIKNVSFLKTFLISLSIFYLLYPKMHMGYDLPLLIFGAIFAFKNKLKTNPFQNIWIAPFLFITLINGNFQTNGIFYLLLPYTKLYYQVPFSNYLHLAICALQQIIILNGLYKIVNNNKI